MKTLLQMSQLSVNHLKNVKDSLRKFIVAEKKAKNFDLIFGNKYVKNVIQKIFFAKKK